MSRYQRRMREHFGQTFIEYTMLVGIIVTIVIAMTPMIKRATQGMVRTVSDQIGTQEGAEQLGGKSGHMVASYTNSKTLSQTAHRERIGEIGDTVFERRIDNIETYLNLGFTEREDF